MAMSGAAAHNAAPTPLASHPAAAAQEKAPDAKEIAVGDSSAKADEPPHKDPLKEGEKKGAEKKAVGLPPAPKEGVKSLPKMKKENDSDAADATTGRRKTRSTTNTGECLGRRGTL